jgi:serine/threonine protein kinase/Flp pilus assembly protein TadD
MKCPKCHFENPLDVNFCIQCTTRLVDAESDSSSQNGDTREIRTELEAGSLFAGRYQVIEELGRGGFGKVYKVFDREINDRVALKLLKPEIAGDEKTIERFRDELKLARQISHRNVCRMFDLNKNEGIYYITMEYVAGEDLKSMIRMIGPMSSGKAILVAKQVCKGLAEAHRLGIAHLDLKSQNIMIDKEGSVRIMDFGIARSLKGRESLEPGALIGTPEYMSPEQIQGKDLDYRSDIYSFGVILYEILTGKVPFEGMGFVSVAEKKKTQVTPDPRTVNPQISADLSRLILKCLERDRGKRYQDMEEILNELREIQKSVPTTDGILPKGKPDSEEFVELTPKNSIAVLPFADLSPQKDQEYFCDGMSEELISALAKVEDLKVASRTAAFQFKAEGYDIRQVGDKLKVRTILEGSVRRAGNRVRITAQLINVQDGYQFWSEKFDRDIEDIFAIQEEISLAIVDSLKLKLLKEEREALVKRYTKNTDAYRLYLKGRYFWNRRYEGGLQKGIEFFNLAIEKDPLYALAYAGIADSFSLLAHYGFVPPKEGYPRAKAAAEKALAIDDRLAEAHASLGRVKLHYDWDFNGSEMELRRALELNPRYATALEWYALFLMSMGRFDEAIAEAKRALESEPLSLIINAVLGAVYCFAGKFSESIEQFRKAIEIDPNFALTYLFEAGALEAMGRMEEAVESLRKLVVLSGGSPFALGYLGGGLGRIGQKEEALGILEKLKEISQKRFVSPLYIAMIYIGLDEKDKVFDYLEKAYQEHESFMVFINTWPQFQRLRPDPRFQALLEKMGLLVKKENPSIGIP